MSVIFLLITYVKEIKVAKTNITLILFLSDMFAISTSARTQFHVPEFDSVVLDHPL